MGIQASTVGSGPCLGILQFAGVWGGVPPVPASESPKHSLSLDTME